MGYENATTPALDALAAHGVVFERAFASAPITLPSHTTMLTGLDPNRHGVHDNGLFVAPPSLETVTERLDALGYDTAAFVSAFVLDSSFGLDQGFDLYDDFTPQHSQLIRSTVPRRDGRDTTETALAWLRRGRSAPFFLWVHYFDVHRPRIAPSPFDAYADSYDGAVAYVDSLLGRLLAGVEQAAGERGTLVIVVADHGEGLGEHDEATHGIVAYDSTLHVPLIVAGPGFAGGGRSRAFARTADIGPTILAAVGDSPLPAVDGHPLQSALADGSGSEIVGYFETFLSEFNMGWARIGGVRTERWKYTAEPRPVELYDILVDPWETMNLADQEPEVIARLDAIYAKVRTGSEPEARAPETSLEAAEKLRSLGYVSAPMDFPPDRAPDPRRFVGLNGRIEDMGTVAAEVGVAGAIRSLEQLIDEEPIGRPLALRRLGRLYLLADRKDDCIRTARELAVLIGTVESRLELASRLLELGRPNEALDEIA
ncbi:MAG: sulfatase, partial [Candidatus Binatia bacterium]